MVLLCAPAQADPITVVGQISQGVETGCWRMTDGHTAYSLVIPPREILRMFGWAEITGTIRTELETGCSEGVPFEVLSVEWFYGGFWPPRSCGATPTQPTVHEEVTVALSDTWGNSCIPTGSAVTVDGYNIYFDVFHEYPPHQICFDMFAPWTQSHNLGHLPPGEYTIITTLSSNSFYHSWEIETCSFAVDPLPVQTVVLNMSQHAVPLEFGHAVSAPIEFDRPVYDIRDVVLDVAGFFENGVLACGDKQYPIGGLLHSTLESNLSEPIDTPLFGASSGVEYPFEHQERFQTPADGSLELLANGGASLQLSFDNHWRAGCEVTQLPIAFIESVTLTVRALLIHDYNRNAAIDLGDFIDWGWCFMGPDHGLDPFCTVFDANRDNDVDLRDMASFQNAMQP